MYVFIFILILFHGLHSTKVNHTEIVSSNISESVIISFCKKKTQLTNSSAQDYEVVEVPLFSRLSLACHYCDEPDDFLPKVWYKQSRFRDNNITELELGVEDILAESRVYTKPDHTLMVNKVMRNDSGIYYCRGIHGEDAEFKYNFLVDVVNGSTSLTIGKIQDWEASLKASYKNLSHMFLHSNRSDFLKIRGMGVKIEMHAEWLPWSLCNGCQKVRTRMLDCKLKPTFSKKPGNFSLNTNRIDSSTTEGLQNISTNETSRDSNSTENEQFENTITDEEALFLKSFEMSCFSLDFEKFFPNISNDLHKVGIFILKETCYAPCKFQFKSSSLPRYKNTLTLEEGDHFTFTCPEASLTSKIVWRKDGSIIEPLSRGENIMLDSFQNLQILSASKDEEANYTCYVDNVRMQEIRVFVHLQSAEENEDLSRYMLYLGLVFLTCFLLYISGLILNSYRRHTFIRVEFSDLEEDSDVISNYTV